MSENQMTAAERLAAVEAQAESLRAEARKEAEIALEAAEKDLEAKIAELRAAAAPELIRLRKAAGKGPGRPVGSKNAPKPAAAGAPAN